MAKRDLENITNRLEDYHYSEHKAALIIGNSAYAEAPLRNPANDAEDMSAALEKLGFQVELLKDSNRREMRAAARRFGDALRSGGVGLFYFAGHGIQLKGKNYLVPLKADIRDEFDVEDEALHIGMVLSAMERASNRLNIVILDACRNNPYARSFRSSSRGLAMMDAPRGTLIAYSTAPGQVAADGAGRNSPYTGTLLPALQLEGLEVEKVFKRVRIKVIEETARRQVPWESSSLTGDFYFIPPAPFVAPLLGKEGDPRDSSNVRLKSEVQSGSSSVPLRSTPEDRLNIEATIEMLKTKGFYDKYKHPEGKGISHQYELLAGGQVVYDRVSGLMWQQSGSSEFLFYKDAKKYIARLNQEKFAGYDDWRLPTLVEAMSLIEARKMANNLYIDPAFDAKYWWIWTSDLSSASRAWSVDFEFGHCEDLDLDYSRYIRAVRFGKSFQEASGKSAKKTSISQHKAKKPYKTTTGSGKPSVILRSTSDNNLSEAAVKKMLKTRGFYASNWNPGGKGIVHQYELQLDGRVVFDGATGLMWDQSGSSESMIYKNAKMYVDRLNQKKYADFTDWRLPTLEEAMSLMTPVRNDNELYIDSVFDARQAWIWTSDQERASHAWCVFFDGSGCYYSGSFGDVIYVRAVRLGQSSLKTSTKPVKKSIKSPPKSKRPPKSTVSSAKPPVILRSAPESNFSEAAVKKMLKTKGLYDKYRNPGGKGIAHLYK